MGIFLDKYLLSSLEDISMVFIKKLKNISRKHNSLVSIGLDIDKGAIPKFLLNTSQNPLLDFTKILIDETQDLVCTYKLNMAFYEVLGGQGWKMLEQIIEYIPKDIIVILDGKRNDIGNTAQKYAETLFEELHGDAVTVNPYMGFDSIKPFLEYKNKCSFILCRTSNPSARDFQDLQSDGKPLYIHVAEKVKKWRIDGTCGVVVGATYPQELKEIRTLLGDDVPFLIPGIGRQGGDIKTTVKYGTNCEGELAIINSSRGIIYAGSNKDFAIKARNATMELNESINRYR